MRQLALFALLATLMLAACDGTPPPTTNPPPETTGGTDDGSTDDGGGDTPTEEACRNEAQISEDPPLESSEVASGAQVEKTWTLTNTGTCAWGEGYVFTQIGGGFLMGNPAEQPLPATAPGERATITVQLQMSTEAPIGTEQEAVFQLRDPEGNGFGQTPFVLVTPVEADLGIPTPTPRDGG